MSLCLCSVPQRLDCFSRLFPRRTPNLSRRCAETRTSGVLRATNGRLNILPPSLEGKLGAKGKNVFSPSWGQRVKPYFPPLPVCPPQVNLAPHANEAAHFEKWEDIFIDRVYFVSFCDTTTTVAAIAGKTARSSKKRGRTKGGPLGCNEFSFFALAVCRTWLSKMNCRLQRGQAQTRPNNPARGAHSKLY